MHKYKITVKRRDPEKFQRAWDLEMWYEDDKNIDTIEKFLIHFNADKDHEGYILLSVEKTQ